MNTRETIGWDFVSKLFQKYVVITEKLEEIYFQNWKNKIGGYGINTYVD